MIPIHPLVPKIRKAKFDFMNANPGAHTFNMEVELPAAEYDAWANTYPPGEKVPEYAYGLPIIRGIKFEVRRRTPPSA